MMDGTIDYRVALNRKKKKRAFVFIALAFLALFVIGVWGWEAMVVYVLLLVAIEAILQLITRKILIPKGLIALEALPVIPKGLVKKFSQHGYDPELGWVRKANTSKIDYGKPYAIDARGSRENPGDSDKGALLSTYGDSYTFCRESIDSETWQYFLAQGLGVRVQNFGVGNYGFDQALLRLKREYDRNKAKVVIIGVVPQTIARILSIWKHFNEFGNVLAFKPSFVLQDGELQLRSNYISDTSKYYEISSFIEQVKNNDFFYANRFANESFNFPFVIDFIANYRISYLVLLRLLRLLCARAKHKSLTSILDDKVVMSSRNQGAQQASFLYRNEQAQDLFAALVDDLKQYANSKGFIPILYFLPMKEDLLLMRRCGHYYSHFLSKINNKVHVIDLAPDLLAENDPSIFYHSSHYNSAGNALAARKIKEYIQHNSLL